MSFSGLFTTWGLWWVASPPWPFSSSEVSAASAECPVSGSSAECHVSGSPLGCGCATASAAQKLRPALLQVRAVVGKLVSGSFLLLLQSSCLLLGKGSIPSFLLSSLRQHLLNPYVAPAGPYNPTWGSLVLVPLTCATMPDPLQILTDSSLTREDGSLKSYTHLGRLLSCGTFSSLTEAFPSHSFLSVTFDSFK